MSRTIRCTVTTPERKVFEGQATSIVVPAVDGELGILPRHAPLVGALGFGELRVSLEGGGKETFFVDGGFLQVLSDQVSVLATRAEPRSAMDPAYDEARLRDLAASRPRKGAPAEDWDAYLREVEVTRRRLRMARRS